MSKEEQLANVIKELTDLTGWNFAVYAPNDELEGLIFGTEDYLEKVTDAFDEKYPKEK